MQLQLLKMEMGVSMNCLSGCAYEKGHLRSAFMIRILASLRSHRPKPICNFCKIVVLRGSGPVEPQGSANRRMFVSINQIIECMNRVYVLV